MAGRVLAHHVDIICILPTDNDDVPVQVSDVCPLPPVQEETQHARSSPVASTLVATDQQYSTFVIISYVSIA